jgi:two-component system NtrC family response regulator
VGNILIIDDDVQVCETMQSLISRTDHESDSAFNISQAMDRLALKSYDLVFLDISLPDGNGLDSLSRIKESNGHPEVIILTGKGDPDGAELAIQGGAWDFLVKPSSIKQLTLSINRAMEFRREKQAKGECVVLNLKDVVGSSEEIKKCYHQLSNAAGSEANTLITGETGTGKELFARTIHDNSSRSVNNFVIVDCASLTDTLVESTLFGHKKGSFTGAQSDRKGLVPLADKGTLFLDEVGEMPLSVQKSFLRVLQERTYRPVGDNKEYNSDFRLISATNRDLDAMVERGEFRQDLLYRIKTIHIFLPALKERVSDIKELALFHLERLTRRYGVPEKEIDPEYFEMLYSYDWPGNVRELFNAIEQSFVATGSGNTIYPMHLPYEIRIEAVKTDIEKRNAISATNSINNLIDDTVKSTGSNSAVSSFSGLSSADPISEVLSGTLPSLKKFKGIAEKRYLMELQKRYDGDVASILDTSGLSRSHFYALLKKHGISQ